MALDIFYLKMAELLFLKILRLFKLSEISGFFATLAFFFASLRLEKVF
jgi:hypothetical protein